MANHTTVDQGNDVPAICEHPDCNTIVHRGIVHICGMDPTGAGPGCGLHFCGLHLAGPQQTCERCAAGQPPFEPKPAALDLPEWRLTGQGWAEWRKNHPELVARTYGRQMAKIKRQQGAPSGPTTPPEASAPTNPPAPPVTPPAGPESPPAPGKPPKAAVPELVAHRDNLKGA